MAAPFSERQLQERLVSLNSSQQSILTVSHWLCSNRAHARKIAEAWKHQALKGVHPVVVQMSLQPIASLSHAQPRRSPGLN